MRSLFVMLTVACFVLSGALWWEMCEVQALRIRCEP